MERNPEASQGAKVVVVGPDGGMTVDADGGEGENTRERPVMEMVEQPAKVMRIGEARPGSCSTRSGPRHWTKRSPARLREIHQSSIKVLEDGVPSQVVEELERLSLPFADDSVPSEAELRVAQAQLVGWLEGLFHGIQTTLFAQQMAARAQLEQMRRALPPGMMPGSAEEAGPQQGARGSGPYL